MSEASSPAHFGISIDIAAPPQRAWEIIKDVERWHEWTASVRSVRIFGKKPLRVGSWALVRQPKLPPAVWRVTEIDEARRVWTWVTRAPGVRATATHAIEATAAGCRAILSIAIEGPLGRWMARRNAELNDRYLALEAQGLKQRSESAETTA